MNKKLGATIALLFLVPAIAQNPAALQKEIDDLKQGQSGIAKDLQEIKELLKGIAAPVGPPAPPPLPSTMDAASILVKGDVSDDAARTHHLRSSAGGDESLRLLIKATNP